MINLTKDVKEEFPQFLNFRKTLIIGFFTGQQNYLSHVFKKIFFRTFQVTVHILLVQLEPHFGILLMQQALS